MKRLNGTPVVHFVNAVVDFDIPLPEAERVMAQPTLDKRRSMLLEVLRSADIEEGSVTDYLLAEFIKSVGVTLAEQRGQELRQLAAPAPAPADME